MFLTKIKRGAKLLDERFPDWEWQINLDRLDLGSCVCCVVGQLTGDFNTERTFGWEQSTQEEIKHGFYVDVSTTRGVERYIKVWERLTAEWKNYILERRRDSDATQRTDARSGDAAGGLAAGRGPGQAEAGSLPLPLGAEVEAR